MEHGGKMVDRVLWKRCAMCGSVMSAWFPSVWLGNKVKLIDDNILNTTQKYNFAMFDHYDV